MEISVVADSRALEGLREEWGDLLEGCTGATIYQTWEWNDAWWKHFRAGKRLYLLQARRNGRLIGIAPFYVSRHYNMPLRRLALLSTGSADYLDVIATDERAYDVCGAFLRYLDRTGGFDLADLQQLSPDSLLRIHAGTLETAPELSRHAAVVAQEPCPFLPLPPSWQEFSGRLGKKMRSNIGYYDRLLTRTFEDVSTRLAGPEEIEEGLSALFALHQRRWNARFLPGVLGGGATQAFHRLAAERFSGRGWLKLHLTTIGGRPVAALYCFVYRRRYYYYLGGFDPDLARYSLGTVLTARAIEDAIDEGCELFDFLRGAEPYKYRWLPEERTNARLLLFHPNSARSRAMLALTRLERSVEHHAKAFAERQGRRKSQ